MSVPTIDAEKCIGCAACESDCPAEAITMSDSNIAQINNDTCIECMNCVSACPVEAISE